MVTQTKIRIKEWGNSLGIIIPNDIVIKENLKPSDEVIITINKKQNLEDFFGIMQDKRIDAQKMKDEGRKLWGMN